jgi:hypothetical protein
MTKDNLYCFDCSSEGNTELSIPDCTNNKKMIALGSEYFLILRLDGSITSYDPFVNRLDHKIINYKFPVEISMNIRSGIISLNDEKAIGITDFGNDVYKNLGSCLEFYKLIIPSDLYVKIICSFEIFGNLFLLINGKIYRTKFEWYDHEKTITWTDIRPDTQVVPYENIKSFRGFYDTIFFII